MSSWVPGSSQSQYIWWLPKVSSDAHMFQTGRISIFQKNSRIIYFSWPEGRWKNGFQNDLLTAGSLLVITEVFSNQPWIGGTKAWASNHYGNWCRKTLGFGVPCPKSLLIFEARLLWVHPVEVKMWFILYNDLILIYIAEHLFFHPNLKYLYISFHGDSTIANVILQEWFKLFVQLQRPKKNLAKITIAMLRIWPL